MSFELKHGAVQLGEWMVFEGLNLAVESGEIVTILGPSGCGKTTLLRACCGLERLTAGERVINGERWDDTTLRPDVTMLFQQPVLYPHLNVGQNIALGLPRGTPKNEVRQQVKAVLSSVGLPDFETRGVAKLSGGEAQRVAFCRALLQNPTVMLLDEPFASVDVQRRLNLSSMTRQHLKQRGITTLHVTHDREEAEVLSDRILEWNELFHRNHEAGQDEEA